MNISLLFHFMASSCPQRAQLPLLGPPNFCLSALQLPLQFAISDGTFLMLKRGNIPWRVVVIETQRCESAQHGLSTAASPYIPDYLSVAGYDVSFWAYVLLLNLHAQGQRPP